MDIPLIHLNTFGFSLFIRKPLIRFVRFDLDTYPLDLTSNGLRWHSYPLSVKSVFKLLYLSIFLVFALSIFFSKQQVSSSKYILLYSLFKITMSGLDVVGKMANVTMEGKLSKVKSGKMTHPYNLVRHDHDHVDIAAYYSAKTNSKLSTLFTGHTF